MLIKHHCLKHHLYKSRRQTKIKQDVYIKKKYDLTEETLTNEVNRHNKNDKNAYQAPRPEAPPIQKQASNRNKTRRAYENAERYLIADLLRNNFTQKIQNNIGIDFNLDIHQVIVIHIYALLEDYETINVSQLYDKLTDEKLIQAISDIALIPV